MLSQNRHPQSCSPLLAELCALYGVRTGYKDTKGQWQESPPESIVAVLQALGAELEGRTNGGVKGGEGRLRAAIKARKKEISSRVVEPVVVAWEGKPALRDFLGPVGEGSVGRPKGRGSARLTLVLEDGSEEHWDVTAKVGESGLSQGHGPKSRRFPRLSHGYHRVRVERGSEVVEATVISAPRRCWRPEPEATGDRTKAGRVSPSNTDLYAKESGAGRAGRPRVPGERPWGVFVPLYALRTERDWGVGDLAGLEALRRSVAAEGGSVVATLPLLAMFFDEPFDPGPYRPVSRQFWNELYLAVEQIPEWAGCRSARELWARADTQARVTALRSKALVDYRGVMALKREVIEKLAESFFEEGSRIRREAFSKYLQEHDLAEDYAAFRAARERHSNEKDRIAVSQYHLYCQWQMDEQMSRVSHAVGGLEPHRRLQGPSFSGLFLDLPLGVHPQGFDTYHRPELFVGGMSVGAPPDAFFGLGQNWDFLPLHPERIRDQGHEYLARSVRHHMRHAQYLRIDHVMGLHRLFWIPEGRPAADGVYVEYPAEEQYAVLCLESQRNRTVVVGEDLGTVPPEVRPAMRRHGLLRTWVLQSELHSAGREVVSAMPPDAIVTLNTHDMFPFVGFLRGEDIEARVTTGQLDQVAARRARAARRRLVARLASGLIKDSKTAEKGAYGEQELLYAAISLLLEGRGALAVVNLEDLLLETRPQNVPGTGPEWANWRRRLTATESEWRQAITGPAGG